MVSPREARQARELKGMENRAVADAKTRSDRYVNQVIRDWRRTGQIDAAPIAETLLRPYTLHLVRSNLMGRKRTRTAARQAKGRQLRLAVTRTATMEKEIRRLAKQLGITSEELLERLYGREAFQILNNVVLEANVALRRAVNSAIAIGLPTRQAVQTLRETFAREGLTSENPYRIETIYRTQTQIAYQAGRWQATQDPDIDEIIWGFRYRTVGDERVRPEHEVLDGVTLPKSDPFWLEYWPPNGYNCRCQVIELFEPARIKAPPADAQPDEGFAFNPGVMLAA